MSESQLKQLSPLSNKIVDKTIESVNRKLFAGARNKRNSRPNAKTNDLKSSVKDSLQAASAESAMAVANRGVQWKEMIQKSLSHGISSLSTMKFDGEFTVKNGTPYGLESMPNTPGVYVVYDKNNEAVYVGDSTNLKGRWYGGHLNENRQKQKAGQQYKLGTEFEEGCTVRFIKMDSEITAAALEAQIIRDEQPRINAREELLTEQGTRSNQEAKKIKDSSGSTKNLVKGATQEAVTNSAMLLLEQLTASILKAIKNELVDIFSGGKSSLKIRIKRFLDAIWQSVVALVSAPLKILEGILEFIVNALSKAINQIYMLARNIIDLTNTAWQLYKGAETMSRPELISKISETIIISGSAILWDALDPIIESQLLPFVGPVAPYLAASISAIGFGLSSHYLQNVVPKVVDFLISCKGMHQEALEVQMAACNQLFENAERNSELVLSIREHRESTADLIREMKSHTLSMEQHESIKPINMKSLMRSISVIRDNK